MRDSAASPAILARLRTIAAGAGPARPVPAAADAWLTEGPARGRLHEVYAAEAEDAGAAAGFAVALALAAGAAPLLWVRTADDERRTGRLHATGLAELGLSPDTLLLVVAGDPAARLRVAADAARCAGLGALVIESRGRAAGLDLTATRRLVLAAEASGVTVLSLRLDAEPVPSAAATRWRVASLPSSALEMGAPGRPAFEIECLRLRGGPTGARRQVEWDRETRSFRVHAQGGAVAAPLAGPGVPVAAGRAAARHPAAPLRRTG